MVTEEEIRKMAVEALRNAGWQNHLSNNEISAAMIGIKSAMGFDKLYVEDPHGVGRIPLYACKNCGVIRNNHPL